MRIRVPDLLLAGAAVATCAHVASVWAQWRLPALAAGALGVAALLGYVAVAGRDTPARVRWPLLAGLLVLAVAVGAGQMWYAPVAPPPQDFGWFSYGPVEVPPAVRHLVAESLAVQRGFAVWALVATCCLAVAVLASAGMPAPVAAAQQRWVAVATVTVALLLLAYVAVGMWALAGGGVAEGPSVRRLGELVGAAWLQLVVALIALGGAVAALRAGAGRLAAAGMVLLALPAVAAMEIATTTVPVGWAFPLSEAPPDYWLTATVVRFDLGTALAATAVLVGAALVVLGCLRAVRRPAMAVHDAR
ncbi:MAG TPA: hypothetical protein VFR67_20760 [Pilimelia sp.]|nr:hypothetical protein [Pilimelia sp.]